MSGPTVWTALERWRATAFLVGGAMFLASAAVTAVDIAVGAEQLRLQLGQTTVGLGWIAGLVGLLGMYPALADRSRWLLRIGLVFTVAGLVGYAIMTAGVVAIIAGLPEADLEPLEPVFLPLMLVGSVLTFPAFGIACLRADDKSRLVGLLLLAQTGTFLANILTPATARVVFLVLVGFVAINVGLGLALRSEHRGRDPDLEASHNPNVRL